MSKISCAVGQVIESSLLEDDDVVQIAIERRRRTGSRLRAGAGRERIAGGTNSGCKARINLRCDGAADFENRVG